MHVAVPYFDTIRAMSPSRRIVMLITNIATAPVHNVPCDGRKTNLKRLSRLVLMNARVKDRLHVAKESAASLTVAANQAISVRIDFFGGVVEDVAVASCFASECRERSACQERNALFISEHKCMQLGFGPCEIAQAPYRGVNVFFAGFLCQARPDLSMRVHLSP